MLEKSSLKGNIVKPLLFFFFFPFLKYWFVILVRLQNVLSTFLEEMVGVLFVVVDFFFSFSFLLLYC